MSRYFTKTLASLEPYTPGEQLKIADIVKLNANENPSPPAPGVAAAVAAAVKNTKTRRTAVGGMPAAVLFLGFRREGNSFDKSTLLTYTEKHA